ncbi:unnamed protein product [Camellia sinensis]
MERGREGPPPPEGGRESRSSTVASSSSFSSSNRPPPSSHSQPPIASESPIVLRRPSPLSATPTVLLRPPSPPPLWRAVNLRGRGNPIPIGGRDGDGGRFLVGDWGRGRGDFPNRRSGTGSAIPGPAPPCPAPLPFLLEVGEGSKWQQHIQQEDTHSYAFVSSSVLCSLFLMGGLLPISKSEPLILEVGWSQKDGSNPSLFDGIPNKDFFVKSVTAGKYLCAETGRGSIIVANRTVASSWETFTLWRINETSYRLRVFNKQFVRVDSGGNGIDMVAMVADTPGRFETFEIVRNSDDLNRVRIKTPNGFFLQVKTENLVTADSKGDGSWGNDDQYVFIVTNTGGLHAEFQLTNGYGPVNAPQVMTEHWNTFIVEDDFNFISSNGINAVRIPIGWWIACDPTPPQPYVGGSLQALDNAFIWAQKYGINVIIDLHAAPGSQNGNEHSSSRDGSQEWGLSDQNIQETANVIDFLTSRYANNPTFYAVELINEPLSPGASLDSLNKYYSAGAIDPQELFPIASSLEGSVIDIHYYNLFSNSFNNMSVQQNIDFIYNNRSAQLNQVTTSNGPLTFIGEWVTEWKVSGVAKKDYQRFGKAQLEVYGRASFGWAYWTRKCMGGLRLGGLIGP